ncbi:MAG: HEAT repeat domain-containing protein [bacterium]|nr:HEAT repeat domain-containing protein [bacterium]
MHPSSPVAVLALTLTLLGHAHADDRGLSATLRRVVEEHSVRGEVGKAGRLDTLVSLGPRAVPVIFDLLANPQNNAKEAPFVLDRRGKELIYGAMRRWPAEVVLREIQGRVRGDVPRGDRIIALQLLSEVGSSRSLETILAVLEPIEEFELHRPYMRSQVRASIAGSLARDPLAFSALEDVVRQAPAPVQVAVVDAVGEHGGAEGIPVLRSLLDPRQAPKLRLAALKALGSLNDRGRALGAKRSVAILSEYLLDRDPKFRRQALDSLRRLRDTTSLDVVLALFEDDDPGVRAAALRVLQEATGQKWKADTTRWTRWYAQQSAILEGERDKLTLALRDENPGRAAQAVRRLAQVRIDRPEVAALLARGLEHEDENVVVSTVQALGALNEPGALPILIDALYDHRARVRNKAVRELRRLTGQDITPEPDSWIAWLYG